MHIKVCRIQLHENLFYATREIGRLYETGRYLHNYGLTYALGLVRSPYFSRTAIPTYQEDLSTLNDKDIYVTPARPIAVDYELNTFKYADNRYRVKMTPGRRNTPSFGRAKELAVGSSFEFAVISTESWHIPRWIRLGKWMSKAALEEVLAEESPTLNNGAFTANLPVNPLDLPGECQLLTYDLISMPPVSLLANAACVGTYYKLQNGYCLPAELGYRFPQ